MDRKRDGLIIEISRDVVVFLLLALPHFHPDYLKTIAVMDTLVDGLRLLTFGVILFLYTKFGKFSNLTLLIFLSNMYIVAVTVVSGGEIFGAIKSLFSIMALVCLYEFGINYNSWLFVKSQLLCYEILVYCNLFSIIFFPNGLYTEFDELTRRGYVYKNFFLGYYTGNVKYYIGALVFAFLYAYISRRYLRMILLSSATLMSSLITNAGAGIVTVMAMCLAFVLLRRFSKLFNYMTYWFIQPIFYVIVIIIGFQNKLFQWIIDNVMHKTYSLNVRLDLWNSTRLLIKKRLIWGYGIIDTSYRQSMVGTAFGGYGHNLIIESLFKGGLIYVALFVAMVAVVWKKISPIKDYGITQIVSIAFLGWSINSLTDASANEFLIALFVLAYYVDNIELDIETCEILEVP